MRPFLATFLHWLHQLGLTLWLGGILFTGAVMAPSVFGQARAAGDTKAGMPLWDFASVVMNQSFERFNMVILVAGVLMLVGGVGSGLMTGLCRRGVLLRAGLTGLAWLGAIYLAQIIFPQAIAAHAAGNEALFKTLHKTYSNGFKIQLLLLVVASGLTALLEAGKRVQASAAASAVSQGTQPVPSGAE